jgi:hypothetical protein
MIIHFDVTLDELDACNWTQVELAISELCSAFRRGDHIVVMRRDVAEQTLTRGWPSAMFHPLGSRA